MSGLNKDRNLKAAAQWLLESQTKTADNGYSAYYDLRQGWSNSYPETTGYIIPTMLKLSHFFGKPFMSSALRATDWLVDIQDEDGYYQGGVIGEEKYPVAFNTGQVIFGLSAAYRYTRNKKYPVSIQKTLEWLAQIQDSDGAWRKFLTRKGSGEFQIYHTRVAWGMLKGADTIKQKKYYAYAIKNLDFSCRFQKPNGWFERTDLKTETNDKPLLHFLAYTVEGLLESGILLKKKKYVAVAKKTADVLLELQDKNGSLKGRYNAKWQPVVEWLCLTGIAQMAVVWARLYRIYKAKKYMVALKKANDFLSGLQVLDTDDAGIRGGIAGSFPLFMGYESGRYLNWATKFFLDALLLEKTGLNGDLR